MEKFIFQVEKQENEENIDILIYSADNKNHTKLDKTTTPYCVYLKKDDFERLKLKNDSISLSEKHFFDKNNEKVLKINIKNKEIYEYILNSTKEQEIKPYEADIDLKTQYLIDKEVEITTKKHPKPLKSIAIDIETIGKIKEQEIIMISTFSPENNNNANKVYVNREKIDKKYLNLIEKHKSKEFKIELLENEKKLLEKFQKDIITQEPQIILGWNVIDFDFAVIKERMKAYNLKFKFSKFEGECKLRLNKDFFRDSTFNCPGVLILDVIQLLRMNFISFEDYKLNTVAKKVLGDEKIDLDSENDEESIEDKIKAIENLLFKDPLKLIEYNFKDSKLTHLIAQKLKLIELIMQRSLVTGTPLQRVKSPIATLDIMYLKKLHKKGYVADSNFNFDVTAPMEGAFVLEPKQGFYENVFVLDFKSLYPSIIMTFNIDPFSFNEKGEIRAPNGAQFVKDPAILPELILTLHKEREKAKKEKDNVKSFALKTTMNSFYGAVGSPKSRYYNKDVGEAITSFGRHLIQKAIEFVEENNFGKVIYGDTDSFFLFPNIHNKFKDLKEKEEFGKKIEAQINSFFKKYVMDKHGQESFLEIEFEKLYSKFFIASKKRYVGFDEISGDLQFVGMEYVRGDWTYLAKNFQRQLIEKIFAENKKEAIEKFIKEYIDKLKSGKFDDLLIYRKKITKPLSAYTKTTPPHVRAARELKKFNGRLVKYVMLESGPKHLSLVGENPKYDYKHYIEKQLKGVSDDILEAFGIDFDKVVNTSNQKSLDRFF